MLKFKNFKLLEITKILKELKFKILTKLLCKMNKKMKNLINPIFLALVSLEIIKKKIIMISKKNKKKKKKNKMKKLIKLPCNYQML